MSRHFANLSPSSAHELLVSSKEGASVTMPSKNSSEGIAGTANGASAQTSAVNGYPAAARATAPVNPAFDWSTIGRAPVWNDPRVFDSYIGTSLPSDQYGAAGKNHTDSTTPAATLHLPRDQRKLPARSQNLRGQPWPANGNWSHPSNEKYGMQRFLNNQADRFPYYLSHGGAPRH